MNPPGISGCLDHAFALILFVAGADPVEQSLSSHFVGLLKSGGPTPRRFEPKLAPPFDTVALASWMSAKGVAFAAPEYKKERVLTAQQLLGQLAARSGDGFRIFAHLSFLISHPKSQYSKLHVETRGALKVLCVSSFYELEFVAESNGYKLSKIRDINAAE